MTVQELIDFLEAIKDKEKPVALNPGYHLVEYLTILHLQDQPHQLLIG